MEQSPTKISENDQYDLNLNEQIGTLYVKYFSLRHLISQIKLHYS